MKDLPKRKKLRLENFDYGSKAYYFLTICVKNKENILWKDEQKAENGFSEIGKIIENEINKIERIYQNVYIDKYVIMPNHIHLILCIEGNEEITVSRIVKQFKGSITKIVGFSIWQSSFYDHVIRNQKEYQEIWKYIDENPIKWELDEYF